MPRLLVLLFLAGLALAIIALIDCISTDEYEIRALPKIVWVFVIIIVLFPPIGPIAWFLAGRPKRPGVGEASAWHPAGSATNPPRRQIAPDDDPEFLRDLAARTRRDEEKHLREWEADLRRREEELGNGDDDPPKTAP